MRKFSWAKMAPKTYFVFCHFLEYCPFICRHCRILLKNLWSPFHVYIYFFDFYDICSTSSFYVFPPTRPGWWLLRYHITDFDENLIRHLMMYTILTKPYGESFDVILIHAPSGESMFQKIRYRILDEATNATEGRE